MAFCFITHVGRAVFLESRAPLVAPARETRHCPHRDSDRCVKSKHATVDSRNRHPRFVNHVCITCAVRTSCFRHVPWSVLDVEHRVFAGTRPASLFATRAPPSRSGLRVRVQQRSAIPRGTQHASYSIDDPVEHHAARVVLNSDRRRC